MINNEQIVFNSILRNPDILKKLTGINGNFFSSKKNNKIFKLIKSGKHLVTDITAAFPNKEQPEINKYLMFCMADTYEIPATQLQDAVNGILKEKLNIEILKLIQKGAQSKTGEYEHKKIKSLHSKIEELNSKGKVELKPLSKRESKPVEWLWESRIPLGTISLIGGGKEVGKSTVTAWIAAQVIKGTDWPDVKNNIKGNVILAQVENDWETQVKPFFEIAGANTDNLFEFDSKSTDTKIIAAELEQHIIKAGNVKLVIFDPITEYVGTLEGNSEIQVRHVLRPFFSLANKYNLSIIIVKHTRKAAAENILDKVGGSTSWVNVPRAVWLVAKDDEDPEGERRKFLIGALNLYHKPTSLAFKFINKSYEISGIPFNTPEVVWESEPIHENPNRQFMDPELKDKLNQSEYAKQFILETLKSVPFMSAYNLKESCLDDGISEATYNRSKARLHKEKKVDRSPAGKKGDWKWSIKK